jgi:CheY-like chemotaxis protein
MWTRGPACHAAADVTLRCLIVDDNATFSRSMRSLLEDEGLVVVGLAASGGEAIRIASDMDADVALVDIDLGEESGFDVARSLSAGVGGSGLPVILISTHDEREVADLVAASPALGFVGKFDLNACAIHDLLPGAGDCARRF